MKHLNKVMLIGRVGREPEMRYMPDGRPVTSFSVGTSRDWTDADGEQHEAIDWFNIVAWDELAERCKSCLHKACQVYVEGRLQTRSWESESGKVCYRTELVAQEMILLAGP